MIITKDKIKHAKNQLDKGNIIIYETDTLYGLGADATNSNAIKKINDLKKRQTPLSIMVKSIDDISQYGIVNEEHKNLIRKILPGCFTILLDAKKSNLSPLVQQNSQKIGIRIPDNTFCLKLLNEFKKPIITTSVNLHGQDAINNIDEIDKIFINIPLYAGNININSKGSTILDLSQSNVNIIRQGDGKIN